MTVSGACHSGRMERKDSARTIAWARARARRSTDRAYAHSNAGTRTRNTCGMVVAGNAHFQLVSVLSSARRPMCSSAMTMSAQNDTSRICPVFSTFMAFPIRQESACRTGAIAVAEDKVRAPLSLAPGASFARAAFQDVADIGRDDLGVRKSTQVTVAHDPARVDEERKRRVVHQPSGPPLDLGSERGPYRLELIGVPREQVDR